MTEAKKPAGEQKKHEAIPNDPYKILGVTQQNTLKEIKTAYRALSRKYHPDQNPGDKGAEEWFKAISMAFSTLTDAKYKRSASDFGGGWTPPSGPTYKGAEEDFQKQKADWDNSDQGKQQTTDEAVKRQAREEARARQRGREDETRGYQPRGQQGQEQQDRAKQEARDYQERRRRAKERDEQAQRDEAERVRQEEAARAQQAKEAADEAARQAAAAGAAGAGTPPTPEAKKAKEKKPIPKFDTKQAAEKIKTEIARLETAGTVMTAEQKQELALKMFLDEKEKFQNEVIEASGPIKKSFEKTKKWWDGFEKTKKGKVLKTMTSAAIIGATTLTLGGQLGLLQQGTSIGARIASRAGMAAGLNMALTSNTALKALEAIKKNKGLKIAALSGAGIAGLSVGGMFLISGVITVPVIAVGAGGMGLRIGINYLFNKKIRGLEKSQKEVKSKIVEANLAPGFDINALTLNLEMIGKEHDAIAKKLKNTKWGKSIVNSAVTIGVGLGTLAVAPTHEIKAEKTDAEILGTDSARHDYIPMKDNPPPPPTPDGSNAGATSEIPASHLTDKFDPTKGPTIEHEDGLNVHPSPDTNMPGVNAGTTPSGVGATPDTSITTHAVHRTWLDNDTKNFDKNELQTHWGGEHGTGIDEDGNYVFDVSKMKADGSFHGDLKDTDATELMKQGEGGDFKMLFSTKEHPGQVYELPVNENGQIVVDPESEVGKIFFKTVNGRAEFHGGYAEVAQKMDGENNFRILSTVQEGHVKAGVITPPHETPPPVPHAEPPAPEIEPAVDNAQIKILKDLGYKGDPNDRAAVQEFFTKKHTEIPSPPKPPEEIDVARQKVLDRMGQTRPREIRTGTEVVTGTNDGVVRDAFEHTSSRVTGGARNIIGDSRVPVYDQFYRGYGVNRGYGIGGYDPYFDQGDAVEALHLPNEFHNDIDLPPNVLLEINQVYDYNIHHLLPADKSFDWTDIKNMSAREVIEGHGGDYSDNPAFQKIVEHLKTLQSIVKERPKGGFFKKEENVGHFMVRAYEMAKIRGTLNATKVP